MDTQVIIYTPKTASTRIETDLVQLTKHLVKKGLGERTGTIGFLGGEYGLEEVWSLIKSHK